MVLLSQNSIEILTKRNNKMIVQADTKMLTKQLVQWSETSLMQRTELHNRAVPTQCDNGTCPDRPSQTVFLSQCAVR